MESLFNYGSEEEEDIQTLIPDANGELPAAVSDALELVRDVVQATEHSEGPNAAPVLRSILSDTVLLTPDVQAVEIAIANTEAIPPAGGQKSDKELADECWLPEEIANDPPEACPADIQAIVSDYIAKQNEKNTTITASLKALQGYRNPDFLQHCVKYDDIQQYGSCYPPQIFDPDNLPEEDYYDRLAAEWNLYMEKKQEERQKRQMVEFTKAAEVQRASVAPRGSSQSRAQAERVASKMSAVTGKGGKWDTRR